MVEEDIQSGNFPVQYRACYWEEHNPTTVISFPVIGFSKNLSKTQITLTPLVFYPFLAIAVSPVTVVLDEDKNKELIIPTELGKYSTISILEEFTLDFSKYKYLGIYKDEDMERDRILVSLISKLANTKFTRVFILRF